MPGLLETLRADLQRYWDKDAGTAKNIQEIALCQGVWATVVYRFGNWFYQQDAPLPLRLPGKALYQVAKKLIEITTGIVVPASATIGPGFFIGHFGTIILHPRTVAGEHCSVGQGVTIGTRGEGGTGVPVLGNNVFVGAGAKVLGGVKLGDNVSVGANAVVVTDVPADSVALGIPAVARPRKKPPTGADSR